MHSDKLMFSKNPVKKALSIKIITLIASKISTRSRNINLACACDNLTKLSKALIVAFPI